MGGSCQRLRPLTDEGGDPPAASRSRAAVANLPLIRPAATFPPWGKAL